MKTDRTEHYLNIIDEIERIRTRNNVNWMDLLRLAFIHSPEEAKKLTKKINESDNKINELFEILSK